MKNLFARPRRRIGQTRPLSRRRSIVGEALEARYLLHSSPAVLPFTSGLVARFVGDSGVSTIGNTVTGWNDHSGSGNNLSVTNDAPKILHSELNGHDVISFDGVNDALGRTGAVNLPTGNSNRSVFMLVRYGDNDTGGFQYGNPSSNQAFGLQIAQTGRVSVDGYGANNDYRAGVVGMDFGWMTQSVVVSGNQVKHYTTGNLSDSFTHSFNTGTNRVRIGTRVDDNGHAELDVAEILVFNRAVSENERQQLENYFRATYLPQLSGFTEEMVTSANQPIALDFLPDGRMLVAQKGGLIRIGNPQVTPMSLSNFLNIPNVEAIDERGLINIAVDPNFANTNHIFAYYSNSVAGKFRISRFTVNGSSANPNSEVMIWEDNEPWQSCCHYGGALDFGPDGKLYLAIGEEFDADQADDLTRTGGKVIRINKDGSIPADNPFANSPNGELPEIYAWGMRNPFRGQFDDVTGNFLISEVGGNVQATASEDVHSLNQPGEDFGWPHHEGVSGNPAFNDPIFNYIHNGIGASIIGGPVYRGNVFPSSFHGAYFYGDFARSWIRYVQFDAAQENAIADFGFSTGSRNIVDLRQGPDGALYYANIFNGVYRIRHDGVSLPPTINDASSNVTDGAVPFAVNFSVDATTTGASNLTYQWQFGDGNSSTQEDPSHTYTAPGLYQAQVFVTNEFGTTASDFIEIAVGVRPTVTIDAPTLNSLFVANQTINYSATANDPDGTLTDASYSWDVDFIHNQHTHIGIADHPGASGTFHIPTSGHDFGDTTGYRFTVTVTDSDGLTATDSVEIWPDKVDITVNSVPTGLLINVDGVPRQTPFVLDTLIGFQHLLQANSGQCISATDTLYNFDGWSQGGGQTQTYTVPGNNATLVANFDAAGSCTGLPVTSGLVFHVQGDNGVTVDGSNAVNHWNDLSTSNLDLLAIADQPTLLPDALNGHDVVSFDGINDGLGMNTATVLPKGSSDRSVFMVVKYDGVGWGGFGWGRPLVNNAYGLGVSGSGNGTPGSLFVQGWGATHDQVSTTPGTGAGWITHSALLNSNSLTHYLDGNVIDTATQIYNTTGNFLRLGAELSDTSFIDLDVAEILVYNRAVSETERQQIEEYLYETYFVSNTAPVAVADNYSTTVGGTIDTVLDSLPTVLANDSDAENDPLSSILVSTPQHGSLVFNTDGTFTYVHDGSNSSSDSFSYYVDDGMAQSSSVMVNIAIAGGNNPPIANNDTYATSAGATINTALNGLDSVLANDSDPDTDPLTAVLVAGPTNGNLTLNSNGSFVYTHNGGPSTTDSFTYRANDGTDTSNLATVSITIAQGNGQLTVTDGLVLRVQGDTGVTEVDGLVTGWDDISGTGHNLTQANARPTLLPGVLNGHDVVWFDGFNDALGADVITAPAGNDDRTLFMVVSYDSVGHLGFSYGANSTNRHFGVGVTGTGAGNLVVESGGAANVFDTGVPGTGEGWMVQSVLLDNGLLTHYRDGSSIDSFTHTFNTNPVKFRMGSELNNGSPTRMYVAEVLLYDRAVTEAERQQIEGYLQTTYFGANFAPVANNESYSTSNGGTIDTDSGSLASVLDNDTDANNDVLTAILVSGPSNGSLSLDSDGHFVYTHNGSATTTDSFTYRADDGLDVSNLATVTINIAAGNTPPVANNDSYSTTNGGTINTVSASLPSVLGNDTDADTDPLTAVLVSGPSNGTLSLNSNGSFVYTHNGSATTSDSFRYRANDGTANSNIATVNISIAAGNTAPVANNDAYATTTGGTINTQASALPNVLSNDTDLQNDTLTAAVVAGPTNGTLSLNSNGEFIYTHNGGATTSDSFTYRANDGSLNSNTATVTISIASSGLPVTSGLVFHVDADMGVSTGGANNEFVNAWEDQALGNDLVQVVARPTFVPNAINGHSAIYFDGDNDGLGVDGFAGLPAGNDNRSIFFVVDYATGSQGGFSYGASASNRTFGLGTAPQGTSNPGNLEVRGRGPSNDFVSGSAGNGAGWMVQSVVLNSSSVRHYKNGALIDNFTHVYDTLPVKLRLGVELNHAAFSEFSVAEILVYDRALSEQERGQVESYLQQTYFGTNTPPVANNDSYSTVNSGTINVNSQGLARLLANDTDANGDPLTASLVSGPSNGTLSLNANGSFVYTHNGSSTTTDSFTYQANDGTALSNVATVTINIAPGNSPPIANADTYSTIAGGTINTTLNALPKVLANDTDNDNDPLTATLLTSTSSGTLSFNADGSFIYVHNGSSTTVDSFTYRANDGTSSSNIATVTINVAQDLPVTSGLVFRIQGDEGVTTDANSLVSGWEDISSNSNDLIATGGKPRLVPDALNGRDVVSFDGINDGLGVNGLSGLPTGSTNRSVFMVVRYDSRGWGGFAFGNPTRNNAFGLGVAGAGNGLVGGLFLQGWGPSNDSNSNTLGNGIGWLTQSVIVNANSFVHYADGMQIDSGTHTYATASNQMRLGVELGDGKYIDMEVAEILVYNRAVSQAERQQIETYLNNTYFSGASAATLELDYTQDGLLNLDDLDALGQLVVNGETSPVYDLDGNSTVDVGDVHYMVENIFGTTVGDANLDGVFNPDDIVQIFQAAEYEDGIVGNSTWSEGDWNADGEFDSQDIVLALQSGNYTTEDVESPYNALPATSPSTIPSPFTQNVPVAALAAVDFSIAASSSQSSNDSESVSNTDDQKDFQVAADWGRLRHSARAYLADFTQLDDVDRVFGDWKDDNLADSGNSDTDGSKVTLPFLDDDIPFI